MENNRNYAISGAYIETINREKSDQLLQNAIESERDERMEATREIMSEITTQRAYNTEIIKKLRNHEHILIFLIVIVIGLLIFR